MQAVAEILQNIVQRPEDYLENIENMVKLYKDIMLHPLEVRKSYTARNENVDICVLSLVEEPSQFFTSCIICLILLLSSYHNKACIPCFTKQYYFTLKKQQCC